MPGSELLSFLEGYAKDSGAPVITGSAVLAVRRIPGGYRVESERGTWNCRCVVIATGHCDVPLVPAMAAGLPPGIRQLTPTTYRNPQALPEGGVLVVGASASGVQLAEEIQKSGREVTLSVGRHTRLPRMYRGQDIMWWLDAQTTLEGDFATNAEFKDARSQPSLQLVGRPAPAELNLGVLRGLGVRLVGRLLDIDGGVARLNDDLRLNVAESHARMLRLLHRIDPLADMDEAFAEAPPAPFEVPDTPATLHLGDHRIRAVIWATGFRRNYRWLHVPVVDSCGEIIQTGGVTPAPGLYVTGIRFMRRRDASFIAAVASDSTALAARIQRHLDATRPSAAA
jgi:putative flavoprotein involved in K+ transport